MPAKSVAMIYAADELLCPLPLSTICEADCVGQI